MQIKDTVKYILKNLPSCVTYKGHEYTFQMFINHTYEMRVCYTCEDVQNPQEEQAPPFFALIENIGSDEEMREAVMLVKQDLKQKGLI